MKMKFTCKQSLLLKTQLIIIILLLFAGCETEIPERTLKLNISQHPMGGHNQSSVFCSIQGKLVVNDCDGIFVDCGQPEPITVWADLHWQTYDEWNGEWDDYVLEWDYYEFDSESYQSFTLSHTVSPTVQYLWDYYYVIFSWTDDDGEHEIESNKAYFTRDW